MSASNNRILSIYKSRLVLLEIMQTLNYDISEYLGFTINEIDAMYVNGKMDMLLTTALPETSEPSATVPSEQLAANTKVYIRYFISTKQSKLIRTDDIDNIVRDLFHVTNTLAKHDTLIIVIDGEPNTATMTHLDMLYNRFGIFVVIHNIKRLQFNLLRHKLVPKVRTLTDAEAEVMKQNYNIRSLSNIPEICRYDPMALAICLRPTQICYIQRKSETAVTTSYFRVCV